MSTDISGSFLDNFMKWNVVGICVGFGRRAGITFDHKIFPALESCICNGSYGTRDEGFFQSLAVVKCVVSDGGHRIRNGYRSHMSVGSTFYPCQIIGNIFHTRFQNQFAQSTGTAKRSVFTVISTGATGFTGSKISRNGETVNLCICNERVSQFFQFGRKGDRFQ